MVIFYICTPCFFHSCFVYSGGGGAALVSVRFSSTVQQQDGAVWQGCKVTSTVGLARLYVAILVRFSEHRLHWLSFSRTSGSAWLPSKTGSSAFSGFWLWAVWNTAHPSLSCRHTNQQTSFYFFPFAFLSLFCFVFSDWATKSDSDGASSEGRRRLLFS